MPLASGARLGPYEILSSLGAGGMGEVYRARDPRLGREVAIKVIAGDGPPALDRVRRFDQEARAVAALGHPGILAVYDVGTDDGHPYVVFELLEGETLRERLQRGPLPPRKAVDLATQILQGLAAAHACGVVHRDLKPSNLLLTRDARVKILDFGLAKLVEPDAPGSQDATATETGVFAGTPGYAAPEQVRGAVADQRADIFALGAVLYEMTTGRKAFDAGTAADTLSAVLHREPAPMEGAGGDGREPIPSALERVVRRCLEKEPEERFQSARDVAFALEALAGSPAPFSLAAGASPTRGRRRIALGIAAVLLAGAATVGGYLWGRTVTGAIAEARGPVRFIVSPPPQAPHIGAFRVSPDGRLLAFQAWGSESSLWLRALGDTEARPVSGTEGAGGLAWSPDSRHLAFTVGRLVRTIDLAGGGPATVAEAGDPFLGDWSPEGAILYTDVGRGAALYRVPAAGGEAVRVSQPAPGVTHLWPVFLPGGRTFLYGGWENGATVHVGSLDGVPSRPLFSASSQPVYTASGHVLFVKGRSLVAQALDIANLHLGEAPFPLAADVWFDVTWGSADFSASRRLLAYRPQPAADRDLVWLDRSGRVVGTLGASGRWQDPDLSPDGSRLVVASADAPDASPLWIFDVARGSSARFAPEVPDARAPLWSRDGRHVYYAAVEPKGVRIFERLADGVAGGRELATDARVNVLYDVAPDGRSLVLDRWGENGLGDLFVLPLDGNRRLRPVIESPFMEGWGRFSPDGNWLAYVYGEGTGESDVFVQPVPPTGERWQVSAGGGGYPAWRADGRELFFLGGGKMHAVDVRPGPSRPVFGTPRALFDAPPTRQPTRSVYLATPDGQRFLFVRERETRWRQPIVVVSDWLAGRDR